MVLHRRILYRCMTPSKEDRNTLHLVIPQSYQKKALKGCHDNIGNLGLEQILDLLQDQLYWQGITKDAELHIRGCEQCIWFKSDQKMVKQNIQATHLLQLVHLDYLTIKATEGGKDVCMSIITDHFIRYMRYKDREMMESARIERERRGRKWLKWREKKEKRRGDDLDQALWPCGRSAN